MAWRPWLLWPSSSPLLCGQWGAASTAAAGGDRGYNRAESQRPAGGKGVALTMGSKGSLIGIICYVSQYVVAVTEEIDTHTPIFPVELIHHITTDL